MDATPSTTAQIIFKLKNTSEPIAASVEAPQSDEPEYLKDLMAQRDKLSSEINLANFLIILLDKSSRERLAFMLNDYWEMLEHAIIGGPAYADLDAETEKNRNDAKKFGALVSADLSGADILADAEKFIVEFSRILDDCQAGDTSASGDKCRRDMARMGNIGQLFSAMVRKQQGD